jgi:thioredoxin 1
MEKLEVLDFYAEWCGPCRAMNPAIQSLMEKHNTSGSSVEIKKINVDQEKELSEKYEIKSIPSIIFLKNGEEVYRTIGAQSKEKIESKISELSA